MKLRLLVTPMAALLLLIGCYDFELESREFSCERNQACQEHEVCFERTCQQRRTSLGSSVSFPLTNAEAGRLCENAQMKMVSEMSDEARCALTGIESSEGCEWGKRICLDGSFPQASPQFICDYIEEFVACPTNLYGSTDFFRCLGDIIDDVIHHLGNSDVCADPYAPPERFSHLQSCRNLEHVCLDGMFSSCTLEEPCPDNVSCVEPSTECGTGYCAQPAFQNPHCTIPCERSSDCPSDSLCRVDSGYCFR